MVSNIDPTKPSSPIAYASEQRENWAAAKAEIEELQDATGATGGPFLPLAGGAISGPLIVPLGTATEPALEFGSDQTGFYMQGGLLILRVTGSVAWSWGPTGPFLAAPFNCNTYPIINMGNANAPTDGLNRQSGDARYAPVMTVQHVQRLEARIKHLEGLVDALTATPRLEIGRGMPTTLGRR